MCTLDGSNAEHKFEYGSPYLVVCHFTFTSLSLLDTIFPVFDFNFTSKVSFLYLNNFKISVFNILCLNISKHDLCIVIAG